MNTDPWTRAPWVGRWPGRYPSQPRVRGRWGSRRPWWSSLPALRYPSAPASGPHTDCAEGNESGARRISSSGCCRRHLMERNRGYQYPVSTGRHQFLLYTQRYLYSVLIQWYQSSAWLKSEVFKIFSSLQNQISHGDTEGVPFETNSSILQLTGHWM